MKSIVLELQADAYNSTNDTSALLRKAYVIAKKLRLPEFEKWIYYELNGYRNLRKSIPDYRKISGKLVAYNPYHGWIPVIIEDSEIDDKLTTNYIMQSISEIEDLVNSGSRTLVMQIPHATQRYLSKHAPFETTYQMQFGANQAKNIIETVRNIVLEWSLGLEEDGILGEGLSFSKEEKSMAHEKGYTVNNYYGNINQSQIQQHSDNSTQTMISENKLDLDKLSELVKVINTNLENLDLSRENHDEVEEELSKIKDESQKEKPNSSIVKRSLKVIGSILEKATTNIIASGIQHEIMKFLV